MLTDIHELEKVSNDGATLSLQMRDESRTDTPAMYQCMASTPPCQIRDTRGDGTKASQVSTIGTTVTWWAWNVAVRVSR